MSVIQASTGSPVKHVDFQRGNSRVVANVPSSPRNAMLRRRPGLTPQKYRAAQQQSRKPSNPIVKPKLEAISAPKLNPPANSSTPRDDDEWQDIDPQHQDKAHNSGPRAGIDGVNLPPPPPNREIEKSPTDPSQNRPKSFPSPKDFTSDVTTDGDSTTTGGSNSFFGFSPSSMSASFMRKLGKHGRNLKYSSWRPHSQYSGSDNSVYGTRGFAYGGYSPSRESHGIFSGATRKSFWLDPSTPGLLALYLQVGFNLVMLAAVIYAIAAFYLTIRNDVNLKVEEYSVDIVNQIAKCQHEYFRNGCEPGKRVPAIEAVCEQWERCIDRDPKEVGRAKVSAETFGSIIEAFLRPIGIKSMIFLICVFAGSFLLVNVVFSSRIGPRFSTDFGHPNQQFSQPSVGAPAPGHAAPNLQTQSSYQPQVSYAPSPAHTSILYSPSPRSSPRHRQPSIHAALQSSPVHQQQYVNYPY